MSIKEPKTQSSAHARTVGDNSIKTFNGRIINNNYNYETNLNLDIFIY